MPTTAPSYRTLLTSSLGRPTLMSHFDVQSTDIAKAVYTSINDACKPDRAAPFPFLPFPKPSTSAILSGIISYPRVRSNLPLDTGVSNPSSLYPDPHSRHRALQRRAHPFSAAAASSHCFFFTAISCFHAQTACKTAATSATTLA